MHILGLFESLESGRASTVMEPYYGFVAMNLQRHARQVILTPSIHPAKDARVPASSARQRNDPKPLSGLSNFSEYLYSTQSTLLHKLYSQNCSAFFTLYLKRS